MRRLALAWFVVISLIIVNGLSKVGMADPLSASVVSHGGIVDKVAGSAFVVEVGFKNVGSTEGSWSVNVAFEGEKWVWIGTAQNLTLKPSSTKTFTWNGKVPANVSIDSVARLIVYYDDSYKALDWWIHVVPSAELKITASNVK